MKKILILTATLAWCLVAYQVYSYLVDLEQKIIYEDRV